MEVTLLHNSPLEVVVKAIRKCYASEGKSDSSREYYFNTPEETHELLWTLGSKDKALIKRIIESDHTSTLEHLSFSFDIDGLSRAALQELARHRHASLSVKSTRYTLKEIENTDDAWLEDYLVPSGDKVVDEANYWQLVGLAKRMEDAPYEIDKVKYMLPESFKTSLIWTVNARSLRNFFKLRSSKRALWEMRELAVELYKLIPDGMESIFEDCTEDSDAE